MTTGDQIKPCELCGYEEELFRCNRCGLMVCRSEAFYSYAAARADEPDWCELCYNESEEDYTEERANFYDYN